jgi:alkylation response protein AidB-like acyl-CoA dehydrogenase
MTLTTAAAVALDDESIAVVDLAKAIFSKHCLQDVSTLTSLLGTAGLIGLGVAEDRGGSGGRLSLSALVAEQAGVHLAPPALLHRQLAVALLAASGAQVERVRAVASGAASALVALDGSPDGRVPFAEDANLVLLSTADGLVHGVRSDAADDDRWKSPNWQECRVSRSTEFEGHRWAAGEHETMISFARALASCYSLGAASTLLRKTVEYTGQREQFGKAIGSFQAVKHSLADAWIRLHHARELMLSAVSGENPDEVLIAGLVAGAAAQACAERCLQAMGGVGYTWESDVHRYLKTVVRLRHWPVPELPIRARLHASLLFSDVT